MVASSPRLLTNLSLPGWPLHPSPHRQISSLNPSSHPSPPRPWRFTYFGCTVSFTGESHPSRTSPEVAHRTPIPRVGQTASRSLPLSTTMTSTPSCLPPWSGYFRTLQPVDLPAVSSRPSACHDGTLTFCLALVRTFTSGSAAAAPVVPNAVDTAGTIIARN